MPRAHETTRPRSAQKPRSEKHISCSTATRRGSRVACCLLRSTSCRCLRLSFNLNSLLNFAFDYVQERFGKMLQLMALQVTSLYAFSWWLVHPTRADPADAQSVVSPVIHCTNCRNSRRKLPGEH